LNINLKKENRARNRRKYPPMNPEEKTSRKKPAAMEAAREVPLKWRQPMDSTILKKITRQRTAFIVHPFTAKWAKKLFWNRTRK